MTDEYCKANYLYTVQRERYVANPRLSRPHTHTARATLPNHPLLACSLMLWRSPRLTDRVNLSKEGGRLLPLLVERRLLVRENCKTDMSFALVLT